MGLPAFKPSDRGLQKDLNQIKVGEIIAWGAHKGKIIKQFREVAGTRMENGVEVYNFVNLAGQVCMPDTPTIKLLELFGLTEENIAELCQTEQDHDLDELTKREGLQNIQTNSESRTQQRIMNTQTWY